MPWLCCRNNGGLNYHIEKMTIMVVANITCGKNKNLSTNKPNELSLFDTTLGLTYLSVGKKQKLGK